jgi:alpha-galactosidase
MDSANIEYIKWDFNRTLTEVCSALLPAERQKEYFHRYVLGLYKLLDRITEAYPQILIEGCASGGGRFDPAWLYYAPQFWTSDDTDAIERIEIQYGTSMCYPTSSMGAHVSACPNHQTRRVSPFKTRGDVAMFGTFGYELDITKLTDEEKELVKVQCESYHKYYNVIHNGEMFRLISPFERKRDSAAWMYVTEDKSEAIVFYGVIRTTLYMPHVIRMRGLDPDKKYVDLESGAVYSGNTLMNAGINLARKMTDFETVIIHLKEVK